MADAIVKRITGADELPDDMPEGAAIDIAIARAYLQPFMTMAKEKGGADFVLCFMSFKSAACCLQTEIENAEQARGALYILRMVADDIEAKWKAH